MAFVLHSRVTCITCSRFIRSICFAGGSGGVVYSVCFMIYIGLLDSDVVAGTLGYFVKFKGSDVFLLCSKANLLCKPKK